MSGLERVCFVGMAVSGAIAMTTDVVPFMRVVMFISMTVAAFYCGWMEARR